MHEVFCYGCDPTSVNSYPYFNNECCFKISGDTLIDNTIYKKLFESSTVYTYESSGIVGYTSGNWQEVELIKEDTLARKVYFRKISDSMYFPGPDNWCGENSTGDSLLFDFSTNSADSIKVRFRTENGLCEYDSFGLDSMVIKYLYGASRHVWFIHGGQQYFFGNFTLIEGIGYSFGLFGTPPVVGIDNYSYSSNLDTYCLGSDSICDGCYTKPMGLTNILPSLQVNIYPNPAKNICNIKLDESYQMSRAQIVDAVGRNVMLLFNNEHFSSFEFDCSGLTPGLYFVTVKDEQGNVRILKLVKQ